jgi:hypothetical protein
MFLLNRWSIGAHDATDTDQQQVYPHQGHDQERQEHDVKAIHLPEVQQVEGTDPNRVERVFARDSDPLCIKVRLRHVAGKRGANASHKDDPS